MSGLDPEEDPKRKRGNSSTCSSTDTSGLPCKRTKATLSDSTISSAGDSLFMEDSIVSDCTTPGELPALNLGSSTPKTAMFPEEQQWTGPNAAPDVPSGQNMASMEAMFERLLDRKFGQLKNEIISDISQKVLPEIDNLKTEFFLSETGEYLAKTESRQAGKSTWHWTAKYRIC